MNLLMKGEKVVFEIAQPNGRVRKITCPASYGMLHDPDGDALPKCAAYVGPVTRTNVPAKMTSTARAYLGSSYSGRRIKIGRVPPPESFKVIGPAVQIWYVRRGKHAGLFYHPFKRGVHPVLEKSGRWYRLSLGTSCIWNDRGFVFP